MAVFDALSEAALNPGIPTLRREDCASAVIALLLIRLRLSVHQGNDMGAVAYSLQMRDSVMKYNLEKRSEYFSELMGVLVEAGHTMLQVRIIFWFFKNI